MKQLIIALATVAALGNSLFSREFYTESAMHPRNHEEMSNQAPMLSYYPSVSSPHYQTMYPGGHGW
jgi:hypothetical protein